MDRNYMLCEKLFADNSPFFHIYTSPPENDLLCVTDSDYKETNNSLAIAATESGVVLVAHSIMSNHIHSLLAATRERCLLFIEALRKRLMYLCHKEGKAVTNINFHIIAIESLKHLRDEIAYVVRNPYAARLDVNPFSYPWCSGFLYYNDFLTVLPMGIQVASLPVRARRAIKHGRDIDFHPSLKIMDGTILPASFVDYKLAMSVFENARQFVWWVTRNVEAHTATANRLGEKKLLTDEEVYLVAVKYSLQEFGSNNPRLLQQNDKTKLVRALKSNFGASNKQIARCTGITLALVNEMFPDRH